jgi:hypothetical protein
MIAMLSNLLKLDNFIKNLAHHLYNYLLDDSHFKQPYFEK